MLKFEQFEGPYGIPVFYEKMPEIIRSTAVALSVFVGSADDSGVAHPGLYHWFEHAPFRGTVKFPNGATSLKGPITQSGGGLNAWTGKRCTTYAATLPNRHVRKGLEVIFDLVGQPLLKSEGILAEREIIKQEIRDSLSNADDLLWRRSGPFIYGDHPFSHSILGTEASLDLITPDVLLRARQEGYDRSRMAFFVASALPLEEVMEGAKDLFPLLPSHGLSERRRGASYGRFNWSPKRIVLDTHFPDTAMAILFPYRPIAVPADALKYKILRGLFNRGGPGSPLFRIVREDRKLAYSVEMTAFYSLDGGYWGFYANTSAEKVPQVEQAFRDVLKDEVVRSKRWYETIKDSYLNNLDMRVPSPTEAVNQAISETIDFGSPYTDEEDVRMISAVSHEQALAWLDEVDFAESLTLIARGK